MPRVYVVTREEKFMLREHGANLEDILCCDCGFKVKMIANVLWIRDEKENECRNFSGF